MRSQGSQRFQAIKEALLSAPVHLCTERALLITDFFRKHNNSTDPVIIQKAKAFRYFMSTKSTHIFPEEPIVGNIGSHRKSAIIHPELASLFVSQDLLWIDKRKTTPFRIAWKERLKLIARVYPYWITRNLVVRSFWPRISKMAHYAFDQLDPHYYLINEAAGIGHFLPNYPKLLRLGITGYLPALSAESKNLLQAAHIACEGLTCYASRMAEEADRLADHETDSSRVAELRNIALICRRVPQKPADTFHEALQSLWFSHMGVCLEGFNSAVSFGRMDQFLYPFYQKDIKKGRLTRENAKELLLCFSAKATEHLFLISEKASQYHGGYLVVQAVIAGGTDCQGRDATNELSYLMLDVMAESGLRDPNYQVRLHKHTPDKFVNRAVAVAGKGNGVPAFFNDEAAVASLVHNGYTVSESREYAVVGCVELSVPGKSFCSTDAALFNLPICLELALNRGQRLSGGKQVGAKTGDPAGFTDIGQVVAAFESQVTSLVHRLITDLKVIETGNRRFHPTPFSSMLVDGCLESGQDVTAGGAVYNSSGIQGVGVADVADSLSAIEEVVFRQKKSTLPEVIQATKHDFTGQAVLRQQLLGAPKFGNDHTLVDEFARTAANIFHSALAGHISTRGGRYLPGFYSSTSHVAFGKRTAALPSGRLAGNPFAASLGVSNGRDRSGPTAILNSTAKIDPVLAPNGYALNLHFEKSAINQEKGTSLLASLIGGFFDQGGMEVQFNIHDRGTLEDARRHPGKHPGLVVRVAGYCAYFDDLPDGVKDEIIARSIQRL